MKKQNTFDLFSAPAPSMKVTTKLSYEQKKRMFAKAAQDKAAKALADKKETSTEFGTELINFAKAKAAMYDVASSNDFEEDDVSFPQSTPSTTAASKLELKAKRVAAAAEAARKGILILKNVATNPDARTLEHELSQHEIADLIARAGTHDLTYSACGEYAMIGTTCIRGEDIRHPANAALAIQSAEGTRASFEWGFRMRLEDLFMEIFANNFQRNYYSPDALYRTTSKLNVRKSREAKTRVYDKFENKRYQPNLSASIILSRGPSVSFSADEGGECVIDWAEGTTYEKAQINEWLADAFMFAEGLQPDQPNAFVRLPQLSVAGCAKVWEVVNEAVRAYIAKDPSFYSAHCEKGQVRFYRDQVRAQRTAIFLSNAKQSDMQLAA